MTSDWTVKQAIQNFYDQHDFGDDGGINEKYAWIKFGFFSIPIPNAESRRQNIYVHDISHIITGNDTTWKGESAVSAWEIASGGWNDLYFPWLLTLWAMGLGVIFYPKNVLLWFRKGTSMKNALTSGLTKSELFSLTVSELRDRLSNHSPTRQSPYVWMLLSFLTFITPFIIGFWGIWRIIARL